jgi:hypothetical protein
MLSKEANALAYFSMAGVKNLLIMLTPIPPHEDDQTEKNHFF